MSVLKIFAAGALLAGCQSFGGGGSQVAVAPPANPASALNGRWVPVDEASRGIYVADFRDGNFVSSAVDGGSTLARGNYSFRSQSDIEIKYTGVASGRNVTANCQLRSAAELYCIPTTSGPFTLRRA